MDALLDLFTLLVFLCVLLGFFAVRSLSRKRQRAEAQAERLTALKAGFVAAHPGAALALEHSPDLLRDQDAPACTRWPLLGAPLGRLWLGSRSLGWHGKLRSRLGLLAVASLIVGVVLGRQMPWPWLYGSLLAGLTFVGVATVVYRNAMNRYLHDLKLSLPQAIDAITRAARAGVPVSNAFTLVAQNISGPLAVEFAEIDNWLRLGLPLRQVMQDSANRIPLNEYRFFAVILIINQEAGGRLGETLDRLSATLRERQELHLKVQAKTSEARASAKIVAALVPCALGYMYLNSPRDFQFLLNDPTGNSVLFYAFGSVTLGLVITHLMVRKIA
ncbi:MULTISPECIES: type II secretion system F family protein [unclassified Pseudomonas]|uniref:type II secretion system F family protein n=1 Tax=unclassified Pseudomonas TaxID=196821 RepID=UPI0021C76B2E|nr:MULTISPECIES: type II secretion system F family protein [unclassified Pseudomonas]MCU1733438.1 type II secretion system F family protein [Pseudomonas sp. 20P_3.2_Bac4]MCU1745832.1 type II secretion system F family protein [Pseudomonas sp. 20P_3.2_Bac5]